MAKFFMCVYYIIYSRKFLERMVVKKSNIITLLLSLVISTSFVCAESGNNLVQLDLKRSSDSSVDVTLMTSDNYGENVLVRKKSDNKYVILIPKVKSSGYKASNLAGVNDLVQGVDVKTVDDTSGGYTKVTLITTKPLDIKTRTTKIAPSSPEQSEYSTLISRANAVRNTISTQAPPNIREQKTEVTVNKAPKVVKKDVTELPKAKIEPVKKPEIKLTEIEPENIESFNRKAHLADLKNEIRMEKALEEIPEIVPEVSEPVENTQVQNIEELTVTPKVSLLSKVKGKIKRVARRLPSKFPKPLGAVLLAIVAVAMISKLGKKSENTISSSDIQDIQQVNHESSYDRIMNSSDLSWREKYKLYLDKSANLVSRPNKNGKYSFIKRPAMSAIDKKRANLEKMFDETANIKALEGLEPEIVESEDNVINNTIKFKAFNNNMNSLRMTSRRNRRNNIRSRKSRFKKYETEIPLHEQKTIELDDSPLSINQRNFEGANLKVSDVDKRRITYEPKEYIMSSVEEFFNIVDSEKPKVPETPVIPSVPKKTVSNPVKLRNKETLKGTIVKSSYKIGQDKGIYLVNKNGKNSLVGKVNDKVFVLKKFDGNITNPIQVRHDNANVYMVKADGFKSLVEVNDDKMGVLIEL